MQAGQENSFADMAPTRSSSRLAHLVKMLPSGLVILDGRGIVVEANPIAVALLGEPLLGMRWLDVINRSFQPRADDGHEVSLRDGRRVKIDISSLDPEEGQLILLTDLTETRQMQQNMAHMQRLSALGKMVASLAHQVRTPLSAAMLYAANLQNRTLEGNARQHFHGKLMARLKDLEQQVNDMLMFARGDSQQIMSEISLQQLLTEVEAGADAMMLQHQSHLEVQLPEPDLLILGNKSVLSSAIGNLIHNAIQAKPKGVNLLLSAKRYGDDQVEIVLADDGPGISRELQQQIFEPFFTTRSQGTGLGLAVVQAAAKSHRGELKVSSELGEGARFSIVMPLVREAEAVMQQVIGG